MQQMNAQVHANQSGSQQPELPQQSCSLSSQLIILSTHFFLGHPLPLPPCIVSWRHIFARPSPWMLWPNHSGFLVFTMLRIRRIWAITTTLNTFFCDSLSVVNIQKFKKIQESFFNEEILFSRFKWRVYDLQVYKNIEITIDLCRLNSKSIEIFLLPILVEFR